MRAAAGAKVVRLAERKKAGLVQFLAPSEIRTARENDLLYQPFGIGNADDADLVVSMTKEGIREPLVVSADGYLLSGHRRLGAANYLGLARVPVRREDVCFEELKRPQRLELLRTFNQQRDKSPGERIREKLVGIDPEEALRNLRRRQVLNQLAPVSELGAIDMGDAKKRARITTHKFLTAVQDIVEANRSYWPLTDRAVHYLLLNDPPLRHDKKPRSHYCNDKASYKALCNLLIRARLEDLVPIQAIDDSTRPVQIGGGFASTEQFIAQETENFLAGYTRNLMQGQEHHYEIMVEKDTLTNVLGTVAREYNIPLTTGRGYASLSPRYKLFRRFKASGKRRLVLFMLSDFDPDGEQIAVSFARSMRDDFGIEDIDARKVALTAEDVEEHNLPSKLDAKETSANYSKFVRKFGKRVVELDAAPFPLLQKKLRDAINRSIDVEEFNAQVELEKSDAAVIEAHRRAVVEAIGSTAGLPG